MAEMSIAILKLFATAFAFGTFVRDTHSPIQRAVGSDVSAFIEVVHATISKFDLRLIDNILVGPGLLSDSCYHNKSHATDRTPNCRPLMTLGVSSMTCSLVWNRIVSVSLAAIVVALPWE